MNWRRLYATVEIFLTVGLFTFSAAGFWAFVIAGLCRLIFGLSENFAFFAIGGSLFFALSIFFSKRLPKFLRNKGIISDDPKKFGPWFKG